jgi:hypothetical protein
MLCLLIIATVVFVCRIFGLSRVLVCLSGYFWCCIWTWDFRGLLRLMYVCRREWRFLVVAQMAQPRPHPPKPPPGLGCTAPRWHSPAHSLPPSTPHGPETPCRGPKGKDVGVLEDQLGGGGDFRTRIARPTGGPRRKPSATRLIYTKGAANQFAKYC